MQANAIKFFKYLLFTPVSIEREKTRRKFTSFMNVSFNNIFSDP